MPAYKTTLIVNELVLPGPEVTADSEDAAKRKAMLDAQHTFGMDATIEVEIRK